MWNSSGGLGRSKSKDKKSKGYVMAGLDFNACKLKQYVTGYARIDSHLSTMTPQFCRIECSVSVAIGRSRTELKLLLFAAIVIEL